MPHAFSKPTPGAAGGLRGRGAAEDPGAARAGEGGNRGRASRRQKSSPLEDLGDLGGCSAPSDNLDDLVSDLSGLPHSPRVLDFSCLGSGICLW